MMMMKTRLMLVLYRSTLLLSMLLPWMNEEFVVSASLAPVEIKAYKFFDSSSGEELVVKGIDYYPRPNKGDLNANSVDLFTDEHRHIWERDIPYLQELGVNAVRLYAVNATANHDGFMCAMEAAGIYVIVALAHDCPTCAVTRDESPTCYPPELKTQGQEVINAFSKYSNTLAFSAGNEVNHFAPIHLPEWNAPCQKKFLRDMRAYIDSCPHLRKVPVGLISADTEREELAKYYNCQTDPNDKYEAAEWYGLNSYVFCDGKAETYDDALGFQLLGQSFESFHYSIPVLLTEFGCLSKTFPIQDGYQAQRNFLQAKWMLEEPYMRDVFSGGFAFEYSMEMEYAKSDSPYPFTRLGGQSYGIGHLANETCDDIQQPCSYVPHPSFYNLKKAYAEANITIQANLDSFEPSPNRLKRSKCPPHFPPLSQFTWSPDATDDLSCPAKGSSSHFVCPADYTTLFSQNGAGQRGYGRDAFGVVFFLTVLVVASLGLVLYIVRENRTKIPQFLSFRVNSNESLSDESNGLLSMQEYASQDGGVGKYQAISSDSSSEDLTAHANP